MGSKETDEILKTKNAELDFANAQLMAQKDELLAMVEELSFLDNKLRESEAALRNAQQIAHIGSWTLDPATEEVSLSDEMIRIYGLDPQSSMISYADILQWIHPHDGIVFDRTLRETLATGNEYELELRLIRKDGARRTILSRGHARPSAGGGCLLVGTSQDITERKQAEEALFHANEKLNMLSSITRHDVLNKLTALLTFIDLSKEQSDDNTVLRQYLDKELEIAKEIQKQIAFTRFYQDIGIQAPEWQDVEKIISSAAGQLKPEGITIANTIHAVEVFADPLIEKVFYNLIENSLRHGEHVREITFSVSECDQGMAIIYQDDGKGISDEDRQKLFRKGFGKHTGLGLFLSREILAITNIGIRESGEFGKGVRFEILAPTGGYRFTGTR